MPSPRMLVTGVSPTSVAAPVEPKVVYSTPFEAPPSQRFTPSGLATLLGLLPVAKFDGEVDVSICPDALIRPTTRGTDEPDSDPASTPSVSAYPVSSRYCPLVLRLRRPSELAVPLAMSGSWLPFAVVGSAIDCTSVPVDVYSSTNTGSPELVRLSVPLPTR